MKEIRYGGGSHVCSKCGQTVFGSRIHRCAIVVGEAKAETFSSIAVNDRFVDPAFDAEVTWRKIDQYEAIDERYGTPQYFQKDAPVILKKQE